MTELRLPFAARLTLVVCGLWCFGISAAVAEEPLLLQVEQAFEDTELFIPEEGDVPVFEVQLGPVLAQFDNGVEPEGSTPEDGKPEDGSETEAGDDASDTKPPVELPPRFIRLHLLDGTVISGDLSVEEITVETEFGTLTVPISRIISLTPGLDSHPELKERVESLIEALGGENFNDREAAHKELVKFGPKVRKLLEARKDDDNAELKKHVVGILKELEELEEAADEFDSSGAGSKSWVPHDTVVTPKFTVVGRVSPQKFTITSKYGPLGIELAHLRTAQRDIGVKEPVQKSFNVPGLNLVQRSFKNSGVRVERGDKISITAGGQIVMSPWGSNAISTPEGGANYQWYINNKIPGGALVAKIGESGEVFKVGTKWSTGANGANRTGTLYFAIAMNAQYAGSGYNYPGQYDVKVRVEPQ